ncbi:hypothetical protein CDL12_05138 [Handroanthus impetiginosus]|uniref:Uncharacterized protein n=1 Tax=Handroanthus impetiginosus TaxID=429701 RepID=A0A2G9HXD0_9LAMI|nr:hypothetical protein CDL12_05138 [Handroanthus impetiginosus]
MIMSIRIHLVYIIITTLLLSATSRTLSVRLFSGQHDHRPLKKSRDHDKIFHYYAPLPQDIDSEKRRVPTGSNPLHNKR